MDPDEQTSPMVHRRQLGKELRALRTEAGKELKDAAEALKCDPSRISKIETVRGTAVPKEAEIHELCRLYGVTDTRTVDRLVTMLKAGQKPGWWESWTLPPHLEVLVGLEAAATTVRAWEPLLVPGLLNQPDYARAVLTSPNIHRPADIEELAQFRAARQRLVLRDENPLELWAIMDESVLRRPTGGSEVMREQLRHLRTMAELPNITIQIVPLSGEDNPGLAGAFTLLDFSEDPTVVYIDSPAGNLYLEKERDTRRFTNQFDLLRATALDRKKSMALIASAAKEI
ncbi:helix-turn-helix domain-containing protein [Streptomyces celluloflavus]|uniref:helix-turn-helix domain-containing protein n=1 Tax=Streptomyces celluloflavus TaxID=58344 RepID=UPI0036C5042B